MKAHRDGQPGIPVPVSPGSKLSRECKVCGAAPYRSCLRFVSGKYNGGSGRADDGNGGYYVRRKTTHRER